MKPSLRFVCNALLLSCFAIKLFATTHLVPSQYNTIQLALNACGIGDSVLVDSGMYYENIVWPNVHQIKLIGTAGSNATTINGNATAPPIAITNFGNDSGIVIDGFSLINGFGCGIYIWNNDVYLHDLKIMQNHRGTSGGHSYGAGIHSSDSDVELDEVMVKENVIDSGSWSYGAGIYVDGGSIRISDSEIAENESTSNSWCYGAGIYLTDCTFLIVQTSIHDNVTKPGASWHFGAGVYTSNAGGTMTNVLIANNALASTGNYHGGGGLYFKSLFGTPPAITLNNVTVANNNGQGYNSLINDGDTLYVNNSIFWSSSPGAEFYSTSGMTYVRYSDVEGGFNGLGNINQNPDFVSGSDFHLQLSSPCIGSAELATSPPNDLENNPRPMPANHNPDMGCYEIDETNNGISYAAGNADAILIYPNPANHFIKVSYEGADLHSIQLYNSVGQQIELPSTIISRSADHFELLLDVSLIKTGTYVVNLQTETHLNKYAKIFIAD